MVGYSCLPIIICFVTELATVLPLTELAAKCVASHIPFELVEHVYPPVPEQLQLRIAFWSFPDNEEDIRLYSCLANGSAEEFQRGENLFKNRGVKEPLQIGNSAKYIYPNLVTITIAKSKGNRLELKPSTSIIKDTSDSLTTTILRETRTFWILKL